MTNLTVCWKADITLPTKVCIVKTMVFPVVAYSCESWTVKKMEHRRIDALELWCWRRCLRVSWTERRSNQSILGKSTPNTSWKDWYWSWNFSILVIFMWTGNSLKKSLMLGKIEGSRKRGHQRMRWLDGISNAMDMNLGKLWEMVRDRRPGVLQSMGSQRVRHSWATEQQHIPRSGIAGSYGPYLVF